MRVKYATHRNKNGSWGSTDQGEDIDGVGQEIVMIPLNRFLERKAPTVM